MKKIIPLFSILLIIGATLSLSFYFLKISKVTDTRIYSFTQDSETNKAMKANLAASEKKVKILFVGDMMFDRWIRQMAERRGADFIFRGIDDLLMSEDLVIGNLEGPITGNSSVNLASEIGSRENYVFTFPPETAKLLYDKNIRVVNIGNNHILNFKESGLVETTKYLIENKVNFFGDVGKIEKRFYIKEINGIKIAFINYNQFSKNGEGHTLDDLRSVKKFQPDFIVVYTHWGTEFTDRPGERNKELAHEFIDNGADLIIGSHPHVVQTKEEYKGKMIYYSLGNFIFDQYFNPNTQKGLAVEIKIDLDGVKSFKEYSIEMKNDGRTVLK